MRTDPYSSSTRVNGGLPSATGTVGRSSLGAICGFDDLMTVTVIVDEIGLKGWKS